MLSANCAYTNGRLLTYQVVSLGICPNDSNAFAHLSVTPNTTAYGRKRVNTFSCSAHLDIYASAFSITIWNPFTRRVIAVPLAVRAGILLAPMSSRIPPITNGTPRMPSLVKEASRSVTAIPNDSANDPITNHVCHTRSRP